MSVHDLLDGLREQLRIARQERDDARAALLDLADPSLRRWWEIQGVTGCSEEEAKRLEAFIDDIDRNHR